MALPGFYNTWHPFAGLDPWLTPWQGLRRRGHLPAVNLYTNQEGAILRAELPGVDPESLDISVQNDTVTLRGNRQPEKGEDEEFIRRERRHGNFVRTLTLPHEIDPDKVSAKSRDGVLEVYLPRAESAKPRKIQVEQSD